MTDKEIIINMYANRCKNTIVSSLGNYNTTIEENKQILKEVKKWIEWVLED